MAPTAEEILSSLEGWRLLRPRETAFWRQRMERDARLREGERLIAHLARAGKLTRYQARTIFQGQGESLFLADYVLLERLGVGAMGQVFKALDRRRNRLAAVKILRDEWTKCPRQVERFQREVRTAAALKHPHIVTSYDAGVERGVHYLAMEFVDGPNLDRHVRDIGLLSVEAALGMTIQVARALGYAHQRGIVHRDVKPSNVLLTPEGHAKILDLGIARSLLGAEDATDRLTHSGQILGTPHYMAPEQALDPKNASPQADIYSLGCTLYRALTGETPYSGASDYEVLISHLRHSLPPLAKKRPDVPPALEAAWRRMMAKATDERYFCMAEVIEDLELCLAAAAGSPALVPTRNCRAAGEDTVTAVADAAGSVRRRARWRMPEEADELAPSAPPSPPEPLHHEASPQSVLRAFSVPQRSRLRAENAALVKRSAGRMRLNSRRRFWQNAAALGASALVTCAGLGYASRVERTGWVTVEVSPPHALVEIAEENQAPVFFQRVAEKVALRLPPGKYRARVTHDRFAPFARTFTVESDERSVLYAFLECQDFRASDP